MGIFDRFKGKRDDPAAGMSSAEAAAAVSPSLDLTERPSAPAGPSSRSQEFQKTFGVAPSDSLYNPYEGALPPAKLTLTMHVHALSYPARRGLPRRRRQSVTPPAAFSPSALWPLQAWVRRLIDERRLAEALSGYPSSQSSYSQRRRWCTAAAGAKT
jgi:hypothetical protein